MDDDRGLMWWAQVGIREEHDEWLRDQQAQLEYYQYLRGLETHEQEMIYESHAND